MARGPMNIPFAISVNYRYGGAGRWNNLVCLREYFIDLDGRGHIKLKAIFSPDTLAYVQSYVIQAPISQPQIRPSVRRREVAFICTCLYRNYGTASVTQN